MFTLLAGIRKCWFLSPPKKGGILGMILDCIWWWGSTPGTLRSVGYFFIAITPRFTLTQSGSTCSDLIYGSNRDSWKLFGVKLEYLMPYNCGRVLCVSWLMLLNWGFEVNKFRLKFCYCVNFLIITLEKDMIPFIYPQPQAMGSIISLLSFYKTDSGIK